MDEEELLRLMLKCMRPATEGAIEAIRLISEGGPGGKYDELWDALHQVIDSLEEMSPPPSHE